MANDSLTGVLPVRIFYGVAGIIPLLVAGFSLATQYVALQPFALEVIFGVILVVTMIRLGQAPAAWGLDVAIGAGVAIVAAIAASITLLSIAGSDHPDAAPGATTIVIAAVPTVLAAASAAVLWRAHQHVRQPANGRSV